jgi:nucleoside-diphosphate-sugar epimerase
MTSPITGRRVVVLGATGWIGRYLCEALSRAGHTVVAVGRKPVPHVLGHEFWSMDLAGASSADLHDWLVEADPDVVVNATDAANATDGFSRTDEEFTHFHVHVVRRLLRALVCLPQRRRIVHLGTILEYGPVGRGRLIGETFEPRPTGIYARTRLAGSQAVLKAAGSAQLDGLVLRLANVCGPHASPATFPGKVLATLRQAAAGHDVPELCVTDDWRDFVDVRDVAEACLRAITADKSGEVINIGSGQAIAMPEFVRQFTAAAGLPAAAVRQRLVTAAGLGGPRWTRTDITRASRMLHWRPRVSLEQSLRDSWAHRGGNDSGQGVD